MGRNRLVFVGASLLLGGCAAAPTRTAPPATALPEAAAAPETAVAPEPAAAEPVPLEMAEPPANFVVDPAGQANGGGSSEYGTGKGETIVSAALQMSSSSTHGDSTQSIAGMLGGGYFLEDAHEVGGQLLVNYIAPPGPNSVILFVAPYYNYNYRLNPRLTVYGGPHMGYARFQSGGDDTNSFQFGAQAGARYWLEANTAAFAEWRYTHYKAFDDNTNEFALLLGLAVTF